LGDHPSHDELSAFLRGDLSAEERRALVRHLLSGCERCSPEIDALLRGQDQDDSAYDAAIERARRSAKSFERKHRREKARIEEIAASLPEDSSAVPRTLSRKGKEDIETLQGLLARSWSLRYENPSEMVRYAMLAVNRAKTLDPRVHGRERVLDLLGRALAELGNAYRVLDQLDAAEEKLEEAGHILGLGTGEESLKMHLLEREAALVAARCQFRTAAAYLIVVFEYHEALGNRHLAGRAMIQRGLYVGYDGNPEQALRLLEEGLSRVDEAQEPELVQTAIHNQLFFITDCGRFVEARNFRFLNAEVLSRDNGRVNRNRLHWLNGRIEAGLGKPDRAEVIFREAKQEFEALERPYVASVVGLDIAAVLLTLDRPDEAAEVVLEAHQVFKALRIKREALVAVLVLFYVIQRGQATAQMAEEVAAFLRRLERDPNARFELWPL
jgi:tetratricopeptide (TPR) repeat protein